MSVLLLTSILGLAMSADCTQISSFYKPAEGFVMRQDVRGSVIKVHSKLDCIMSQCSGVKPCAVAFHSQSRQCVGVFGAPTTAPVLLKTGVLLTAGNEDGWTTFVSDGAEMKTDGPAALWLLDSELRGRNLGVKGQRLNMTETGLTWSSAGPRGAASSRKYAKLTTSNRASVQLLHGAEYVLKMNQPFTMATWLRTEDVTGTMAIFQGIIDGETSSQCWFHPNEAQSQLYFNLGGGFGITTSEINSSGRLQWRHVSVVFEGGTTMRSYLNGQEWKISNAEVKTAGASQPKVFQIGYRETNGGYSGTFKGSMACMTVYERALTAEELQQLMNICP